MKERMGGTGQDMGWDGGGKGEGGRGGKEGRRGATAPQTSIPGAATERWSRFLYERSRFRSWAVSTQATEAISGRLPLLSGSPVVTFPAAEHHHRPLAGIPNYTVWRHRHMGLVSEMTYTVLIKPYCTHSLTHSLTRRIVIKGGCLTLAEVRPLTGAP